MFTWICPKCGKEVSPSYADCPNCAATAEAASAAGTEPAAASPPPSAPAQAEPDGSRLPGWLMSLLFAGAFIVVGVGAFLMFRSAPAASTPSAPQPGIALETPSAQSSAAVRANPALKNLEITGLRLTEDSKQKAFLQFVAVNHSGADLGEIRAKVDLKAATARHGQEAVGTFAFKTTLGPYESKELKMPVDTKLRVYELPDWQYVRAEITGP